MASSTTDLNPILVTGAAGFIGHAVAHRLLDRGERVLGLDNFNDYYDPALKDAREKKLVCRAGFTMIRADIADEAAVAELVGEHGVTRIVHLAAQAGVRYSLQNPFAYERSNVRGHLAVLEAARHMPGFRHLVYASSSSVYGDRPIGGQGFREDDPVDAPASLYAATKRACELMSASYARLYAIPQTGLRFFTVYGPWGRPDMAYFDFTAKMSRAEPINVYGHGKMARDFTYIDDIVDGIVGALDRPPDGETARILNIGNGNPVGLMEMIETIESLLDVTAHKVMQPMQAGDVTATFADTSALNALTGYRAQVNLAEGLRRFVDWYKDYHLPAI